MKSLIVGICLSLCHSSCAFYFNRGGQLNFNDLLWILSQQAAQYPQFQSRMLFKGPHLLTQTRYQTNQLQLQTQLPVKPSSTPPSGHVELTTTKLTQPSEQSQGITTIPPNVQPERIFSSQSHNQSQDQQQSLTTPSPIQQISTVASLTINQSQVKKTTTQIPLTEAKTTQPLVTGNQPAQPQQQINKAPVYHPFTYYQQGFQTAQSSLLPGMSNFPHLSAKPIVPSLPTADHNLTIRQALALSALLRRNYRIGQLLPPFGIFPGGVVIAADGSDATVHGPNGFMNIEGHRYCLNEFNCVRVI